MAKYLRFETSDEVMDTLFAIIDGNTNVKSIMKALKQPQSTVSSKLQFLRDNDIIIKDKWNYSINWNVLNKVFLIELRNQMKMWLKDETKINKFIVLFNENRIRSILKAYATLYIVRGKIGNINIQQIINDYFHGIMETEDKELRKTDKRFVELKKLFGMDAFEWALFFNSEYIVNKKSQKV
jgi:DNA-binding transcriptional ArsR family regulator